MRFKLNTTNRLYLKHSNNIITEEMLKKKQSLPLEEKIDLSLAVIQEWYEHWNGQVYVSFSGGKDSTVLLHLVRSIYPEVVGVFVDTGLEYPEIRNFVKRTENIIWLKPTYNFQTIIKLYGFPLISKEVCLRIDRFHRAKLKGNISLCNHLIGKGNNQWFIIPKKYRFLLNAPFKISKECCKCLKKSPFNKFETKSQLKQIRGILTYEGRTRKLNYLKRGCNAFDNKRPFSDPLSFWIEKDIWEYIEKYNIDYSTIYDKGYYGTGCMFCLFGIHLEKSPNRFELMKETHPAHYKFCMEKLGLREVLEWTNKNGNLNIKY